MKTFIGAPHLRQPGQDASSENRKNWGKISLEDCLAEHTKEELLEQGNEWYCNSCKEHKKATKIVSFCPEYLPQVLVLSLKRFEFRNVSSMYGAYGFSHHREKIDVFIDFPISGLDISPYCGKRSSMMVGEDNAVYDLFAVCNHYGRMGFGHYTAFTRDWSSADNSLSEQWYMFDDDSVSPVAANEVKTSSAYILFYRRKS